jgi:hypothetical protein
VLLHSTPKTVAAHPWTMWMPANLFCFLAPGCILAVTVTFLGDWRSMMLDSSPHEFAWTAAYVSLGSGLLTLLYGELIFFSTLRELPTLNSTFQRRYFIKTFSITETSRCYGSGIGDTAHISVSCRTAGSSLLCSATLSLCLLWALETEHYLYVSPLSFYEFTSVLISPQQSPAI